MSWLLERSSPARLGIRFRWLLASSWTSSLGDGLAWSAGPLLVASRTHNPVLVAAAGYLQQLPVVLFGLLAGALADRLNRKTLIVTADLLRSLVVGLLVAAIVLDIASIAYILATVFLLGVAETFSNTTYATLMPMLVQEKRDYGVATARLTAGFIVMQQLIGPPVGALLFSVADALPFAVQTATAAAGALLIVRIHFPEARRDTPPETHIRRDIVEGVRWLWHHAAVRTLTLTIVMFNVTYGAAWSVLVLYAEDRLHMGPVGFGLLTTSMALGGILGIASYSWLERHVSLGNIMRVGLIIETFTHLGLALTTAPAVALSIFFVFGAHAFIWSTVSSTVRQRAVPIDLQGRVASVYLIGVFGGIVVGAFIGGFIAHAWGLTAPFWFAFFGSAIILTLIWGRLAQIAHADEEILTRGS